MSGSPRRGPAVVTAKSGLTSLLAGLMSLVLLPSSTPAQTRYARFPELQMPIGIGGSSFHVADLNSDGNPDMVMGDRGGQVWLLLGDGRGGLRLDPQLKMPPPEWKSNLFPDYVSVDAGDIDGDGDLDLAIGTVRSSGPTWAGYPDRIFLGDGKGNFVDGTKGRLPQNKDITSEVQFIDIDRDKDLDLLCAGVTGTSRLYLNNGKGYFTDETLKRFPKSILLLNGANFAAGDLDGDGDTDLVLACSGFWAVHIPQANVAFRNNGKGFFSVLPVPFMGHHSGWVALGDMDKDGDLDIVTANYGPNGLYLNDGKGNFVDVSAKQMPVETKFGSFWSHDWVGLDDVDDDGDLDMIFSGYYKQWLVLYPNDGTAHFTAKTKEGIDYQGTIGATLADFDRDGDREICIGFVYYNLQKQLYLSPKDLVRGKATSFEIHAARGPRFILSYVALKESRIPLLPWGTFFLDPTAMLPMGSVILMTGGKASFPLLIPNDPLLAGKKVYLQGVVFDMRKARFLGFTNETANSIR